MEGKYWLGQGVGESPSAHININNSPRREAFGLAPLLYCNRVSG